MVCAPRGLEFGGQRYGWGEALSVSEKAAERLVAAGLVEIPGQSPPPTVARVTAEPPPLPAGRKGYAVCPTPGCPNLVARGKCKACAAKARGKRSPTRKRQGYDRPAWRAKSRAFLAANPWCDGYPAGTHGPLSTVRATVADHVDGLGPAGPRGFDTENLQPLCASCHNRKTGEEHGGHSR